MARFAEFGPRALSVGLTAVEVGGTVGGLVTLYGNRLHQLQDWCTENLAWERLNTVFRGTTPQPHERYAPVTEVLQALRDQFNCATALTEKEINAAAAIGGLIGLILVTDKALPQNGINRTLQETGESLRKLHPIMGLAVPAVEMLSTVAAASLPFMIMEYAKITQHLSLIEGNESTWEQIFMRYAFIPVILAAGKLLPAVVNVAQSGVIPLGRSIGNRVLPRIRSVGERIGDRVVVEVRDAKQIGVRVLPSIRSVGERIGDRIVVEVRDVKQKRASRKKPAREGPESIADILDRSRILDRGRRQAVESFKPKPTLTHTDIANPSVTAILEDVNRGDYLPTKRILFGLIFRQRLLEAIRKHDRGTK